MERPDHMKSFTIGKKVEERLEQIKSTSLKMAREVLETLEFENEETMKMFLDTFKLDMCYLFNNDEEMVEKRKIQNQINHIKSIQKKNSKMWRY